MADINSAYDQTSNYESFESFNSQSQPQIPEYNSEEEVKRDVKMKQQLQPQMRQMQESQPQLPQQMPSRLLPPMQKQPINEGFNNYGYQNRYPEYSFWDRMVMSKREVLKLFILSIVIILAISLEKFGSYYLNSYLTSTDLTTFQEFMVRLSFPVIVFLFLWIIKSL